MRGEGGRAKARAKDGCEGSKGRGRRRGFGVGLRGDARGGGLAGWEGAWRGDWPWNEIAGGAKRRGGGERARTVGANVGAVAAAHVLQGEAGGQGALPVAEEALLEDDEGIVLVRHADGGLAHVAAPLPLLKEVAALAELG